MKERTRKILGWSLLGLTLAVIWGNSLMPVRISAQMSNDSAAWLQRFLQLTGPVGLFVLRYLRKIAHFLEYTLLGAELMLLLGKKRVALSPLVRCLSAALWAAVADESLQILSGRGPLVTDVLLDLCGALHGWLWAALIVWAVRRIRRRKAA